MGFVTRFAAALSSRVRISVGTSSCSFHARACGSLAVVKESQLPQVQNDGEEGYEAWWRQWKEHRQKLPRISVGDVLASRSVVVLDANIGSVFARMTMIDPPAERRTFLNMLMGLIECKRLSAPPKLMHRYSISNHGADKILIPYARIGDGDKQLLGDISQKLMDWIVESKFELARQPSKSMDFLITMMQCAFLYKSTLLLTNNKDYYFFARIAKEMNEWLATTYPQQASLINMESVHLVFVHEQMKLDVYKVFKPEKPPRSLKPPATKSTSAIQGGLSEVLGEGGSSIVTRGKARKRVVVEGSETPAEAL